jgi:hypothetical protein
MYRKPRRSDIVLTIIALLLGLFVAWSTNEWMTGIEHGKLEARKAKVELIAQAGLFELHNEIYTKVGPLAWENRVKPAFMGAITLETIRDTGDYLPDWRDIVNWVRAHPERTRQLLKEAAKP